MPPLSPEDVVEAVQAIPGLFPRRAQRSAQEIGNGNVNDPGLKAGACDSPEVRATAEAVSFLKRPVEM